MGESKKRRDRERLSKMLTPEIPQDKCSVGSVQWYCCHSQAWEHIKNHGEFAFYYFGEPLDPRIVEVAYHFDIDCHDLDYHVEAIHGWETHDFNYEYHLQVAAGCMVNAGYQQHTNKEICEDVS